nr:hypothetical protein Iba_chr14cCG6310 [Ipomoea batatas]
MLRRQVRVRHFSARHRGGAGREYHAPPLRRGHHSRGVLRARQRAVDVDVEHAAEVVVVGVLDALVLLSPDAGVAEHYVQLAVLGDCGVDRVLHVLLELDVAVDMRLYPEHWKDVNILYSVGPFGLWRRVMRERGDGYTVYEFDLRVEMPLQELKGFTIGLGVNIISRGAETWSRTYVGVEEVAYVEGPNWMLSRCDGARATAVGTRDKDIAAKLSKYDEGDEAGLWVGIEKCDSPKG